MTIDNLDIQISASLDKSLERLNGFVKSLDEVKGKLAEFGNVNGFGDIAKNISNNLAPQMQKVSKNLEQITEQFKDLGKGFTLKGSTSYIQKQIDSLTNSLEKAKIKKQELESSGKTGGQAYEDSVRNVIKYENQIESLKNQLAEMQNGNTQIDIPISGLDQAEKTLEDFEKSLRNFDSVIEEGLGGNGALDSSVLRGLQMNLEQLQRLYPEAEDLIISYEEEIKRANELTPKIPTKLYEDIDLSAFEQANIKASEMLDKVNEFNSKLGQIKVPEIREENLDNLRKNLDKTEAKLDELRTKLSNALAMGDVVESVDDSAFVRLREQIAYTERQAEALRQKIAEVESQSGKVGLSRLASTFAGFSDSGKRVNSVLSGFASVLRKIGSFVKGAASRIGSLIKSLAGLRKESDSVNVSLSGGFKTFLRYAVGVESIFTLINKLRDAIKEGLGNLARYSNETNASMSLLQNSLNQVKNATAAASGPILNSLAPAMDRLIQVFIDATNHANQLIAALSGSDTWVRAKRLTDSYTDSIEEMGKAARNAVRPFDELKTITTQDGGRGSGYPSDMFETLPVENSIANLADKIREAFDRQDFEGIGAMVSEKVNAGLQKLYDLFDWGNASKKVQPFVDGLTGFLNGLLSGVDFGLLGSTLNNGLQTVYNTLVGLVNGFDWETLGTKVANGVKSLFQTNGWWQSRARWVGSRFKAVINTMNGFVTEMNTPDKKTGETGWQTLGVTIGEGINTVFDTIPWVTLGDTFTGLFNGIFQVIGSLAETIDGYKIGTQVSTAIQTALSGINWETVKESVNTVAEKLAGFLNGLIDPETMYEVGKAIAQVLNTAIGAVFTFFNEIDLDNLGESIASGVNGFIDWFDLPALIRTLDKVVNVIFQALVKAVSKIHWGDALAQIGESLKEISIPTVGFVIGAIAFTHIGKKLTGAALGLALKAFAGLGTAGLVIGGIALTVGIAKIIYDSSNAVVQGLKKDSPFTDPENWNKSALAKIGEDALGIASGISESVSEITKSANEFVENAEKKLNDVKPTIKVELDVEDASKKMEKFKVKGNKTGFSIVQMQSGGFIPNLKLNRYEAGGFPKSYSAFIAGENGIPEILGTVGGRNAVAGGEEITGIRDAVYSTSQQEIDLLRQQNQLLQAILQKEYSISQNDIGMAARRYSQEYFQRTGKPAYQI